MFSQVGINTAQPHASAALEVAGNDKGFLPPRIVLKGTNDSVTIAGPAAGLLIYNKSIAGNSTNAVVPGYYYWNGSSWTLIGDTRNTWGTSGNNGTDPNVNFIGTTDNQDLIFKRAGIIAGRLSGFRYYNTSFGVGSYKGNTGLQGRWNTAIGYESLKGENGNMIAHDNTAVGSHSLTSNYDGEANTAIGYEAMKYNKSGKWNIGIGYRGLIGNKTGSHNIAIGKDALGNNSDGMENTAVGFLSLTNHGIGKQNVALGAYSGGQLSFGNDNIIIGTYSARNQTSGSNNIVIGSNTELKSTTGDNQLNIGNSIYGNNVNAGAGTFASIGINTNTPGNSLEVKSEHPNTSGLRLTNFKGISRLGTNNEGDLVEIQSSVRKVNTGYTITGSDEIILADAASSGLNLTLPAASQKGRKITVKKTEASGNPVLIQSSSPIDGQSDISISQPYSGIVLLDDGNAYWVVGKF
ncbi:hypothetical protein [Chryseobacterium lathyri]|uniref:Uncharacterized protein n=1 Tax=Chryseobacterium lathyri TaxID=395933 RepID=A0ABT9SK21_9FLAO|nr:hypothetical protein [Chryseobacterium lathyri]MDP9959186.1 hypothetical protein [Chryseobacterium lathyri]